MKPWKLAASSSCRRRLLGRMRRGGERVLHRAQEPRLVERLDQEVEGAGAHRLHGAVDRAVRGDDDHPRVRRFAPHRLQELEAVAVGKLQVEQHQMRLVALAVRPRLGQAEGADHPVTGPREHGLVERRQRRRVLHEQDAIGHPELPHRMPRRSRAKATAASISAMQPRTPGTTCSGASEWAAALSSRAQASAAPRRAPRRPRSGCATHERIGARSQRLQRRGELPLRRQQVGDHLVEQLVHRVRPDRRRRAHRRSRDRSPARPGPPPAQTRARPASPARCGGATARHALPARGRAHRRW